MYSMFHSYGLTLFLNAKRNYREVVRHDGKTSVVFSRGLQLQFKVHSSEFKVVENEDTLFLEKGQAKICP